MASRIRHVRARVLKALFRAHTWLYEASDGRVGAHLRMPMLLLTVIGRKTGQARTTALAYFEDNGSYVVIGSDGGARRHPHWWLNLSVNPRGKVRVGRRVLEVTARLAEGGERARLWVHGGRLNPDWHGYQKLTKRELPVVILTPVA